MLDPDPQLWCFHVPDPRGLDSSGSGSSSNKMRKFKIKLFSSYQCWMRIRIRIQSYGSTTLLETKYSSTTIKVWNIGMHCMQCTERTFIFSWCECTALHSWQKSTCLSAITLWSPEQSFTQVGNFIKGSFSRFFGWIGHCLLLQVDFKFLRQLQNFYSGWFFWNNERLKNVLELLFIWQIYKASWASFCSKKSLTLLYW